MKNTYKSIAWMGGEKLEIIEKPIPIPGKNQVLVEIKAAGICGTDFHIIEGKNPQAKEPPLVLGHEFGGIIVGIGSNLNKSILGTRIISDSYIGCGDCKYCNSNESHLCEKGTSEVGVNTDGAWAEYIVVPYKNITKIPDNIEFSVVGAGCILNCPVAAIRKVNVNFGDTVVIIGDGPSSLVMVQLARLRGAKRIILSGHREERLKIGLMLGADEIVNTHNTDLEDAIKPMPKEDLPQVVIDAVGKDDTFSQALRIAGKKGRVLLFGLPGGPVNNLPIDLLLWKELTISGSTGAPDLWETAIKLLERGYLNIKPLISHRFRLEQATEAIKFINENPKKIVKAIFEMN